MGSLASLGSPDSTAVPRRLDPTIIRRLAVVPLINMRRFDRRENLCRV